MRLFFLPIFFLVFVSAEVFAAKFFLSKISVTIGVGASDWDSANAVTLDGLGNIFIAGNTNGALGEANGGGGDAFMAKFNSTGVLFSSPSIQ